MRGGGGGGGTRGFSGDNPHQRRGGDPPPPISYEERAWVAIRQARLTMETTPRTHDDQIRMLRNQLVRYLKGLPYASRLREAVVQAKTIDALEDALAPLLQQRA